MKPKSNIASFVFQPLTLLCSLLLIISFQYPLAAQTDEPIAETVVDLQPAKKVEISERLQAIFSGDKDPESVDDLKAIEAHVKQLVEQTSPMTVGLIIGEAAGSGVIITKDGYVLTAGHVSMKPNLDAKVILSDGTMLNAKTLGVNSSIDSGLLKITDEGSWPYLEMGTSASLKRGQWIIALGHPGGYEPGRKPVLRLGRILSSSPRVIRTDCVLIGGDSGGPLIDMYGQVIGIHSRINEKVNSNYHVPIDTYGETWDRLVKGDSWGSMIVLGGARPYLGFKLDEDSMRIKEVTAEGPADKAGLEVGDTITRFADREVDSGRALRNVLIGITPGQQVELVVMRGDKELTLGLEVGERLP
jgi:serine protease Do